MTAIAAVALFLCGKAQPILIRIRAAWQYRKPSSSTPTSSGSNAPTAVSGWQWKGRFRRIAVGAGGLT
jgi:hypothetical protein